MTKKKITAITFKGGYGWGAGSQVGRCAHMQCGGMYVLMYSYHRHMPHWTVQYVQNPSPYSKIHFRYVYHPVDAKHVPMLAHLQPTVSPQCLQY